MVKELKKAGLQFTLRDIEIIKFVSEFGFVEINQIQRRFRLSIPVSYRLLKRFVNTGFMYHERMFYNRPGIYYLTPKGAKFSDLPAIEKINAGYYEHQIYITDVYMKIREQFPDAHWISERRLKHEKFYEGVGKRGHISDGILLFPDGSQIAIEVELSVKGKVRIDKILKGYVGQFAFKEVWYFCSPSVVNVLTSLSEKIRIVKIFNLEEFLK